MERAKWTVDAQIDRECEVDLSAQQHTTTLHMDFNQAQIKTVLPKLHQRVCDVVLIMLILTCLQRDSHTPSDSKLNQQHSSSKRGPRMLSLSYRTALPVYLWAPGPGYCPHQAFQHVPGTCHSPHLFEGLYYHSHPKKPNNGSFSDYFDPQIGPRIIITV